MPRRKIRLFGKTLSLPVVLAVVVPTLVVAAVFLPHFLISKPSQITIVENTYKIEVYTDDTLLTIATEIGWSDTPMAGDLSPGLIRSMTYYLSNITELTADRYIIWNCSDVAPMSLVCAWKYPSGVYTDWVENAPVVLTAIEQVIMFRFDLDCNAQPVGTYDFNIDFFAGEDL